MTATREINILLIEDTEEHAILTKRALLSGKLKPTIYLAKDGKEALDFLYNRGDYSDIKANPMPDIIVLDLKLPKISGLQVLEQIKDDDRLSNIPVVVLTSSDEAGDIIGCYQAGAESFVTKSVVFLSKGEKAVTILEAVMSLTGVSDKEVTTHGT